MEDDSAFQVDILVKSVHDLQQQRSNLDRALQDARSRKRAIEDRLESISTRHGQVKDINTKMTETLKVAKLKVAQTHDQMTQLEKICQENKAFVKQMTDTMEEERKRQLEETFDFERNLAEISKKLKEARFFYSSSNMDKEMAKMSTRIEQLQVETTRTDKETEVFQQQLNQLEEKAAGDRPEVETADQRAALSVFEDELGLMNRMVQSSNQQTAALKIKMDKLKLELSA